MKIFEVTLAAYRLETSLMVVEAETPEEACQKALEQDDGDYQPYDLGESWVEEIRSDDQGFDVPSEYKETPAPRAAVILEGGNIQNVVANRPFDLMVIDYDTDGADPGDVVKVEQFWGDGVTRTEDAYVTAQIVEVDAEETARLFELMEGQ